jgi:Thioredoxin
MNYQSLVLFFPLILFLVLSSPLLEVVFCKVDVDENPDTAAKYSVSAMPTFVFISKGVVVDRLMGVSSAIQHNIMIRSIILCIVLSSFLVRRGEKYFSSFTWTIPTRSHGQQANPAKLRELIEEHM